MAVDYEKLRKKAKKRDEEKQKKDAYEYSRSMYEGAKKNRSNVSANTYKLYYDDYIKNTKAYKNEQKKGINDERKSQLKAVLNMINPLDSVSASEAKKNYKSAQKEKEKKQSAYDKLKEEYEALNGSKQKKNLLMSEIGKVGETLYGNPYDAERKNEVKQIYNKSKQEAYEQQAYDADIKQKAREETAAKNKSALSKDKEISKKAEQAYKFKNAIVEKNKASGADDMSSAMLNAMGVGSKGQNDVDYSKKYNDSLKELQSLINKKGYKDIKAEDLIDYYVANKNNEQQAKVIKGAEKAAQEHPVIMQAARTLTSPLRAQANIANTIDMAVNGKSSINGTADFITNAAYGTRKGLEDKAANDGLINLAGKKIGPISVNKNNEIEILGNNMGNVNAALYDNIDQMAENVYNSLLFGGGITGGITASGKAEKAKQALINGVFSTAAMGDDMSSQLASGSSSGETIKSSVKSALINFLTEMVGAPLEWADVKGNSTFGKILVSGLNEGTEEIIGNVVDRTYDQITQGQLSELSQLKRSYLEQGLSEQEADKEVVKSMLAEDIFAALQAGFAGAVMSGSEIAPNKIIESTQNNIDNKKLGAEAKAQSNSDIQAIIDEGLSKNKNSKAYKYAEELQAKVKTSQANGDVLAGASIYDEADYSKINEKRLGQLQTEIVKEGFKENIATAIEGEKNEDRINKAISKMVNGFELSRYDVKVIKDSEKAINAINEQFGSDFTEKDISNDSLEALSAKLKNGYTDYSFTYGGYNKYQQRAENAQNAALEENTPNVLEYTQKPAETFTAEQQSDNPKYNVNAVAITADGNQAEVKIYGKHPFEVSTDRSNFKVKTSAGDIDYNNISFENQTQQVLTNEIINKNFGNSGANAVFVNFDPNNLKGASVSTYVSQAKMLYDLGVAKPDVPFNEFVMRNPAFYPAVKFLGDKAINIYRSGQTDAKSYDAYIEEQRKNKKSPTKTTRHIEGEYKNISDSDSTIDDVFIKVAKKTRVDIERHSDGRQGGNGQFIPSLAKIIINADGSGEYNALIHELGEFGLAYNEQEYKNVQSAIRDWYVSYKGADNFNALVDAYIDTYTKAEGSKTRAEAIDELTNDAVSGLFSTDEGVEQFAKWLSDNKTEAEKKSIIETIADFLKSVIEKIKSVIATSNLQTAARNAMEMEQKRADHIRKQFLNMLDNASNNLYNGTEVEYDTTSIKFSRNIEEYPYDMQTVIKDYLNSVDEKMLNFIDEFNSTKKFARHTISEVNKKQIKDLKKIIGFDFTGYSNGINTNALKHIEKRHGENGKADNSMKNKNDLARINYVLENYDNVEVVDKSSKEFNNSNNKSAQIILFKKKINGTYYLIESAAESKWKKLWVISAYINKNDTVTQVSNDVKNVPQSYVRNELASPVSNDNVTQNKASVNNNETKFSLDIDSDGNKLTQQQAEYFKNSKVRDEDGNLLKVYHGTFESFTVFDKTKGRANMDIQGIFFSPWELDAKGYGKNVNAYYINITNPASEQMGYKALRKFQGQNNAGVKAREYLERLGYDGVNNGDEEYIAFNSNQIKLADNLTPTENEDIRFSRDVNIDEFDETEYTNVKLSKAKYNKLYSEALTWDSDKVGQICYKCFNNKRYYYILNEDYDIKILGVYNSNDKKGAEYKNVDRKRRNISGRHEVSENTNGNDRSHNGFVSNGRTATNNAELNKEEIQREGDGNRTRIVENDDNDNLSEEKYSRDVDYAEYADLKRENKHLKEINEVLKHQFELTNGREVSTYSLLKAARKIIKLTPTRMTGADVEKEMKSWHTLDTSQQFFNAAYDLAQKLVENEKQLKYQPTQEEQEMLDYLKNTEIKLSDKQKEEVSYYFGSYGKYKNAARGKINITENGILLDDLANEMEELFGGLMPSDNSQDLPIALLDMVNTYKNKVIENVYGYSKEEYLESLANDILSYYFKTNLYETKADKNEKRFLKARSKYAQQISNYQKLLADEKAKHKKEFSEFRKEQIKKNQDYRSNLYRDTVEYKAEYRQKQKEKRERSLLYKSFQKSTIRLAQLAKQDKKNHIPNNIVEAVKGIVNVISFGTKLDDKIYSKLYALDRSFKSLNNNDDYEKVTEAYNGYIRNYIEQLQTMIGDRNANQLTLDELKMVDDLVRTTVQVCNNVNKIFYSERNKTIEQSVSKVEEELKQVNAKYKIDKGIIDSIKYGSMKPEYFFEYLGSDELLKLYRDVRKGEDTWAVTIDNSKNYADDVREKYDWKSWDRKKRYDITTSLGDKLNLNLEQIMAIYAMSNRKQTLNHIIHGGIVVTDKPKSAIQTLKDKSSKWNDSLTHRLSYSDISKIRSMLSDEQRNYVRDMVKYLSTDMAEKGNEISRRLYDVELFKEENYYPARTAKNYMHRSSMETIGAKKIINSGFTNAIVEKAKNPLLLEEFDNVWASHVDEMANYNAFALPLENFDRVYNYHSSNGDDFNSIRTLVENAYGKKATGYISDLLEDLNGGVVHEAGTDIVDKLTSMFKKNAVFASASVAIQQPSAIGRAFSIINPKYFLTTHGSYKKGAYEEIKKYAPVAIIKEMGYFDTNMAQSTVDYLNNVDYKGLEKVPAFFKDGAFRDEVFGYTASKADEITWSHIWNACKAEAKDKYPNLSTEESLQKAGERFTEVITKTQVYDSVFSRSALMRSKNGAVKMATAFMAEPTTSLNMLVNAAVQAKRGKFSKGKATRIVASLVIASVINALLQSIVTAARNDDDDKTYLEAYLAELIPNFIDNANPVNQIAFVKDVANIFKGYDVTRADMDSVGDLVSAVKNLWSDNLTPWKKVQNIAGALGAFIGWPIENVMRDVRSVYNMVHKGLTIGLGANKSALKSATMDGIKESLVTDDVLAVFGLELFPEKDKQQMIYEAIKDGDKEMYKRIADNVSNPDNYIKKGLIENDERVATAGLAYLDGDIGTAINTAKELESDGFDYELAYKAIKAYSSEIQKAAGYKADSDDKKYKQSLETLISSGTDKETVKKAIDTVEIDEEQDSKDSKFFTNNDLATAIYKNDLSTLKEMVGKNKQVDISNGKSKEEAEDSAQNSIKSALVKGKKEIAQAGIDYSDNNIKTMIDVADELENNYEYTTVIKAIKSYYSTMKSAKEALDDKDDDTYNQKLKELIASGMDKSTVESAIKKIVVTDSDSQNESQLFNEDDLSAAIESGDNNTLNKVCESIKNVYIANGSSKDEAEEKLQQKIKKAKYGKRKTTNVLNANNTQQIRSYINEKVNSYVDSGKSVKQSANYTRKSIDGILELRYKNGNADKKADVLTIMVKTGLYGDRRAAKQYADEHYLK